jgi:hypothetical protein
MARSIAARARWYASEEGQGLKLHPPPAGGISAGPDWSNGQDLWIKIF